MNPTSNVTFKPQYPPAFFPKHQPLEGFVPTNRWRLQGVVRDVKTMMDVNKVMMVFYSEETSEYACKEPGEGHPVYYHPVSSKEKAFDFFGAKVKLPISFNEKKVTRHDGVSSVLTMTAGTSDRGFKSGFEFAKKWTVTCPRHKRTLEIVISKTSNEYLRKEKRPQQDEITQYIPIPEAGTVEKYCGQTIDIKPSGSAAEYGDFHKEIKHALKAAMNIKELITPGMDICELITTLSDPPNPHLNQEADK